MSTLTDVAGQKAKRRSGSFSRAIGSARGGHRYFHWANVYWRQRLHLISLVNTDGELLP